MSTTSFDASIELTQPDATIQLMNGPPITYNDALNTDKNIIQEAQHVAATKALYQKLWADRNTMSALIKHHLGLGDQASCTIAQQHQWMRGNFNVCVPVEVQSPGSYHKLILRCAMPHKLAEAHNPGSMDEKTGCEVGAYAWIQERCPDIRIPHLYGFGFSDQRHVRLPTFLLFLITDKTTYSLPTKLSAPHTYALRIIYGACSALSSDVRPFSHATPITQPATTSPQHTCCSNTLDRTTARCSQILGISTEGTPFGGRTSSKAWLD